LGVGGVSKARKRRCTLNSSFQDVLLVIAWYYSLAKLIFYLCAACFSPTLIWINFTSSPNNQPQSECLLFRIIFRIYIDLNVYAIILCRIFISIILWFALEMRKNQSMEHFSSIVCELVLRFFFQLKLRRETEDVFCDYSSNAVGNYFGGVKRKIFFFYRKLRLTRTLNQACGFSFTK
jgi:hypothetical protein